VTHPLKIFQAKPLRLYQHPQAKPLIDLSWQVLRQGRLIQLNAVDSIVDEPHFEWQIINQATQEQVAVVASHSATPYFYPPSSGDYSVHLHLRNVPTGTFDFSSQMIKVTLLPGVLSQPYGNLTTPLPVQNFAKQYPLWQLQQHHTTYFVKPGNQSYTPALLALPLGDYNISVTDYATVVPAEPVATIPANNQSLLAFHYRNVSSRFFDRNGLNQYTLHNGSDQEFLQTDQQATAHGYDLYLQLFNNQTDKLINITRIANATIARMTAAAIEHLGFNEIFLAWTNFTDYVSHIMGQWFNRYGDALSDPLKLATLNTASAAPQLQLSRTGANQLTLYYQDNTAAASPYWACRLQPTRYQQAYSVMAVAKPRADIRYYPQQRANQSYVQLDGTASIGEQLRYQWELQAPADSQAQLVNADSTLPKFVPNIEGSYLIRLTVTDHHGLTSPVQQTFYRHSLKKVYRINANATVLGTIGSPNPSPHDQFGAFIEISKENGHIFIAAPGANHAAGEIYEFNDVGVYLRTIRNPSPTANRTAGFGELIRTDKDGNVFTATSQNGVMHPANGVVHSVDKTFANAVVDMNFEQNEQAEARFSQNGRITYVLQANGDLYAGIFSNNDDNCLLTGWGLAFDQEKQACYPPSGSPYYFIESNLAKVVNGYGQFTLIIKTDGTLWGVGSNEQGQLGLGESVKKTAVFKFLLANVKNVAVYPDCAYALGLDGRLYATGKNNKNQFELADTSILYHWTEIRKGVDQIFVPLLDRIDDLQDEYGIINNGQPLNVAGADSCRYIITLEQGNLYGAGHNHEDACRAFHMGGWSLLLSNVKDVYTFRTITYAIHHDGTTSFIEVENGNYNWRSLPVQKVKKVVQNTSDFRPRWFRIALTEDGELWGLGHSPLFLANYEFNLDVIPPFEIVGDHTLTDWTKILAAKPPAFPNYFFTDVAVSRVNQPPGQESAGQLLALTREGEVIAVPLDYIAAQNPSVNFNNGHTVTEFSSTDPIYYNSNRQLIGYNQQRLSPADAIFAPHAASVIVHQDMMYGIGLPQTINNNVLGVTNSFSYDCDTTSLNGINIAWCNNLIAAPANFTTIRYGSDNNYVPVINTTAPVPAINVDNNNLILNTKVSFNLGNTFAMKGVINGQMPVDNPTEMQLVGEAEVSLLGTELQHAKIYLAQDRLAIEAVIFGQAITLNYQPDTDSFAGATVFRTHLNVAIGPISVPGPTVAGQTYDLKLAKISLNSGFAGTLEINIADFLSDPKPQIRIGGQFQFGGVNFQIPKFVVSGDINSLPKALENYILNNSRDIFNDLFTTDPSQWLKGALDGLLNTVDKFKDVLTDIAGSLEDAVAALKNVGVGIEQTIMSLELGQLGNAGEILQSAWSTAEIGASSLPLNNIQLANLYKLEGYSPARIISALGLDPYQAADTLKSIGYGAGEIGDTLKNLGYSSVETFLGNAGFSTVDIRDFNPSFGVPPVDDGCLVM
jgi:hypothetical protein